MTEFEITIPLAVGTTVARHYPATDDSRHTLFVLAHGAGAGQRHPFMTTIAQGLAGRGIDVVTFDFAYVAQKRRVPDRAPVLEDCFERVIRVAMALPSSRGHQLFIGGKSMGGRMATHLAARPESELPGIGIAGIVALGYPLHPPGKPEQPRTAHLPAIARPVLIVQGERDVFGTPKELEPVMETMTASVTLHTIGTGDHSLKVRGSAQARVYEDVLDTIAAWMGSIDS